MIAGTDALTRDRLAHVDQYYLRPDCYRGVNAVLIDAQAEIGLAQLFGGGLVAAVDGMRFVVPIRSVDARPNPKYFARKRGVTWLNMISDQAIGLTGRVLSGTPRDTLHFVDLVYDPHGGPRPEVLITDQGSYSDLVFGIVTLLGFDYRPVLADLPDTKLWRIDASADYGYLDPNRPGPQRPGQDRPALAGHPAGDRLHPHPGRSPPTTPSGCCNATAGSTPWARRSPTTAGSSRPCTC